MINLFNKFRTLINVQEKLELDKKKIILIILIGFILLYMDFSFLIRLQFKNTRTLGTKISKLKKDIDILAKDLATLEDLKQRHPEVKKEALSKVKKIISEEQIPSLLKDISDIATKYNVKIMQIKPSKELKKEDKVSVVPKFNHLLITLDLICGYHSLGSFINGLENAERFMAVQDLKITPDPNNYLSCNIALVLKTYVKK